MKMKCVALAGGLVAAALYLTTGCDWSSQGSSLNTSQGAGVNVNFSGVYNGTFGGGKAVKNTSAGSITRLVLHQAGNNVKVTDNQGSTYEGSIGSPGAIGTPTAAGTYPAGAELVQSQISFSGKDDVSQKDVEFVGVIHAVAVTDLQGNTTSSSTSSSDATEKKTTSVFVDNTNRVIVTVSVVNQGGVMVTTTTTVTQRMDTGEEISRTVTTEKSSESTATTEYSIRESQTQFRLEGTWVEKDSPIVSDVDALSPGNAFTITTTETTTTEE